MESSRGGHSRTTAAQSETPEPLLDVFKSAALSVTKLYKISAAAESRARTDGYQECLDDLLAFLDKEKMGLMDGEGWKIRGWATARLDGKDAVLHTSESDEEVDRRNEAASSPEITRASVDRQPVPTRTDSAPPPAVSAPTEIPRYVVPSSDSFTFQSQHPYPNIAELDLSDGVAQSAPSASTSRPSKSRLHGSSSRSGLRSSGHLGRGAGSKRKMDFNEFFPGCFPGKDLGPNGSKRSRHT